MTTYATQDEAERAADATSRLMLINGEIVDFDGQNCEDTLEENETCGGWDGNDRRCECGNRRVGWSFQQTSDSRWFFYAAAY